MTFEERVEKEVNIQMAKRLLKDESYEGGSFYINEVQFDNNSNIIQYKNQWIRQPMLVNEITINMIPIAGSEIRPGKYMFIRLES
ncbi:MAG: hypothetical protein ACOCP4_05445 [Candidatus Woesearchaeota archaeon]